MKPRFKNQAFQQLAVDAVADLFLGQERQQSMFQIDAGATQGSLLNEFGVGNELLIDDDRLATNMKPFKSGTTSSRRVTIPVGSAWRWKPERWYHGG